MKWAPEVVDLYWSEEHGESLRVSQSVHKTVTREKPFNAILYSSKTLIPGIATEEQTGD